MILVLKSVLSLLHGIAIAGIFLNLRPPLRCPECGALAGYTLTEGLFVGKRCYGLVQKCSCGASHFYVQGPEAFSESLVLLSKTYWSFNHFMYANGLYE
jgi:hypothetical protein